MSTSVSGFAAVGEFAVGDLPAVYDVSTPSFDAAAIARRPDRIILLIARPFIIGGGGATFTIYAATDSYVTRPSDTPANQLFKARLIAPYNMQFSLYGGVGQLPIPKTTVDGKSQIPNVRMQPSYGVVEFAAIDGTIDSITRLQWVGCEVDEYVVAAEDSFANAIPIARWTCGGITWTPDKITLSVRDLQTTFQIPLQTELYTGGAIVYTAPSTPAGTATIPCPAGARSIEAWIKPTSTLTAGRPLIGWQGGTAGCFGLYFNVIGPNYLSVTIYNDAGVAFTVNDNLTLTADEWVNTAAVLDIAGTHLYLYINRTLRGSVVISGTFTAVVSAFTVANAAVSELRIWSSARSLTDLAINMYLSYPDAVTAGYVGLYAYYIFSEGAGTTTVDSTGVHGVITLNGGDWTTGDWQQAQCLGKQKPVAIGDLPYPAEIPLQLVDPNAPGMLIYQAHHRAMQSFYTVRHTGVALVLTTDYTVDTARGYVFILFNPTGQITAELKGDIASSSVDGLGWVSTKADICVRIATVYGGRPYPSGIDLSAVANLNAADSSPYGIFIADATQIATALDMVMDGGSWGFNKQGEFTLAQIVAPGTPSEDITQNRIVYGSLSSLPTLQPSKRQRIGFAHVWQTQSPGQLSATLSAADRALLSKDYSYVSPGANLALIKEFPLASDVLTLTLRYDPVSANNESIRKQAIFGQQQHIYKFRVVDGLFSHQLGDTLTVTYREETQNTAHGFTVVRYDLNKWKCVVIGLAEVVSGDPNQPDTIEYTVWGLMPPSGLIIDTSTLGRLVIDTGTGDKLAIESS